MDTVRRLYRRGQHMGYRIHGDYCQKDGDGMSIRISTTIEIVDDYLAGKCHLCRMELPPGTGRQICLNCLGEQSGFAFAEASNRGDLLEYVAWKQQQALVEVATGTGDEATPFTFREPMISCTLLEAEPIKGLDSLEQSISDLREAIELQHELLLKVGLLPSRTAADLSADDWKELQESQEFHDAVTHVVPEEASEDLPPGDRGHAGDYYERST